MTTDIRIRVNGNYVAEGKLTITRDVDGQSTTTEFPFTVGPNRADAGPIEHSINVPHGSNVAVKLTERHATEEEIAAVNKPIENVKQPLGDNAMQGSESSSSDATESSD